MRKLTLCASRARKANKKVRITAYTSNWNKIAITTARMGRIEARIPAEPLSAECYCTKIVPRHQKLTGKHFVIVIVLVLRAGIKTKCDHSYLWTQSGDGQTLNIVVIPRK